MNSKVSASEARLPESTASGVDGVISVVFGRVSTEDGDRVLETIAALAGDPRVEIVIADRLQDELSDAIARSYPKIIMIACPSSASLPEMRTIAFERSTGAIVAVTEDHCVPAVGWLDVIAEAFREGTDTLVAVGGCVENGVKETGFDWATFLCEYSFFSPPVSEGRSDVLPGMNVAYRRTALESVPRAALTAGFWETTVHPLLLGSGGEFLSLNRMKMFHCKKFSRRLFAKQRYIYSRYYAGNRYARSQIGRRLAASAGTALLPPLLLWRMISSARAKGLGPELWRALPSLAVLVFIWSAGEIAGYLAGPGDALARIE